MASVSAVSGSAQTTISLAASSVSSDLGERRFQPRHAQAAALEPGRDLAAHRAGAEHADAVRAPSASAARSSRARAAAPRSARARAHGAAPSVTTNWAMPAACSRSTMRETRTCGASSGASSFSTPAATEQTQPSTRQPGGQARAACCQPSDDVDVGERRRRRAPSGTRAARARVRSAGSRRRRAAAGIGWVASRTFMGRGARQRACGVASAACAVGADCHSPPAPAGQAASAAATVG